MPAEEHEADDAEPGQQIRRIERLLAEADDDFQPAGSIGPEIELCFEESAHPFQEEFEHEEVVADRYAAAVAPAATPKKVADPEGQPERRRGPESETMLVSAPVSDPGPRFAGGGRHPRQVLSAAAAGRRPRTSRVSAVVRPTPPRLVP